MIPFFQPTSSEVGIFREMLKLLGKESVEAKNPEAPLSPYDWSNLLADHGIRSMVVQLETHDLYEVEFPALAYVKGYDTPVIVEDLKDGFVEYWTPKEGRIAESISAFGAKWTGVMVLVSIEDPYPFYQDVSGSDTKKLQSREVVLGLLMGLLATMIGFSFYTSPLLGVGLVLKLIGSLVGMALLAVSVNNAPSWLHKICHIGKQSDCGQVLSSSPLPLKLPLSDINLIYFGGGFLGLLLSWVAGGWPLMATAISWLAVMAAIVSIYTLAYQVFVVKAACPLCLVSTGILWVEAYTWHSYLAMPTNIQDWILLAVSASIVTVLVVESKMGLELQEKLSYWDWLSSSLREDPEIFEGILSAQPRLKEPFEGVELVWGCKEEPEIEVLVITNPYCTPCQKSHATWEKLIWEFGDSVCFKMRFSRPSEVGEVCLALASVEEDEAWQQTLHDWMEGAQEGNEHWEKHQRFTLLPDERALGATALQHHISWVEKEDIPYTPCVFVNGMRLPDFYKLEDIKHYLRG